MSIRRPVVAGQFYAGGDQCAVEARQCITALEIEAELPKPIVAGIVPHAGWVFSGDVAGMVFKAIKQANGNVDTFILFGAAHRYYGSQAGVYDSGKWETPMGQVEIDEDIAKLIVNKTIAIGDRDAHAGEHSIEVQIPFIQELFKGAKIVPIVVPGSCNAVGLGEEIAKIIFDIEEKTIVCVASTDLTHYGPRYGFDPAGAGQVGIDWAKNVNDADFIDKALKMDARGLLSSALKNYNACGPGASSAVVAAARGLGAEKGILLAHTTSAEVMVEKFGESSSESVGYAGLVF